MGAKKFPVYKLAPCEVELVIGPIYKSIIRDVYRVKLTVEEQGLRLDDICRVIGSSKKVTPRSRLQVEKLQRIREIITRRINQQAKWLARKLHVNDLVEQEIVEIEFKQQLQKALLNRLQLLRVTDAVASWQKALNFAFGVAAGGLVIGVAATVVHHIRRNEEPERALKRAKNNKESKS